MKFFVSSRHSPFDCTHETVKQNFHPTPLTQLSSLLNLVVKKTLLLAIRFLTTTNDNLRVLPSLPLFSKNLCIIEVDLIIGHETLIYYFCMLDSVIGHCFAVRL